MRIATIVILFTTFPFILTATSVTFKIKGLRSDQGLIWVGVYQNQETFLKEDSQITECRQQGQISQGMVDVICSLEPGTYGAAAYHDENSNHRFDTTLLGLPDEGYGFPTDVKPKLGPPDFEEVLFTVGEGDVELTMEFQY